MTLTAYPLPTPIAAGDVRVGDLIAVDGSVHPVTAVSDPYDCEWSGRRKVEIAFRYGGETVYYSTPTTQRVEVAR